MNSVFSVHDDAIMPIMLLVLVSGCMAERLKTGLLEADSLFDVVCDRQTDRPVIWCTMPIMLLVLVSGCMAERLKTGLLEEDGLVDVVCGPDAYRDLPRLLALTQAGQTAGNW